MSRQFEDDDEFDNEDGGNLVAQLRKQLREAKKEAAEAAAERDTLRVKARTADLSEVVKSKGLDPRVAKLYPKDAEATPEAVDAWVSEFGDLFGLQPNEPAEPDVPADEIAASQRIQNAQGTAAPSTREAETLAKLQGASTAEELIRILQQGG